MMIGRLASIGCVLGCVVSCGGEREVRGTAALFDVEGDLTDPQHFYDFPFPSDLRLLESGGPDLRGLPESGRGLFADFRREAMSRRGFPVLSAGYFRFSGPIAPRDPGQMIPAEDGQPLLLVDVDPASDGRGQRIPLLASTPKVDPFVPDHLLAVGPRAGFVLAPSRTYAYVVLRSLGDAAGAPLSENPVLADLAAGRPPAGDRGARLLALYEPLWPVLADLGLGPDDVAAATVFTTGDVVAETFSLSEGLLARDAVEVRDLVIDPDDGETHDRYCELQGTVTYPQFQRGTPPFNTDGLFELVDGLPVEQREEQARVVLTLPKTAMPTGGFPLVLFFHGSGSLAEEVVDRGRVETPDGAPRKGEGPAHVLALHGFAMAASSLPINPERLPGATDTEYLNIANPVALRDTFRQGIVEQRLFVAALEGLRIPPDAVAACGGLSLPEGETSYRFATEKLFAMGNSMGGMYTNMIGAVEPRVAAIVPSGAAGFWTYFILDNPYRPTAKDLVASLLSAEELTLLHPAMHVVEMALEPADPIVYMPRLGLEPLPEHPARHVYEPVGREDKYFPIALFDAVALAFGNRQAGDVHWQSMQDLLALGGLGGILSYPVTEDVTTTAGEPYTGVVVQYVSDGEADPHSILFQLDTLKHQYGCFFETVLTTGTAVVPAPGPTGTPCP